MYAGFVFIFDGKMAGRGGVTTRLKSASLGETGVCEELQESCSDPMELLKRSMMEKMGELERELMEVRREVSGIVELKRELAVARKERDEIRVELEAAKHQLAELVGVKNDVGVLQDQTRIYREVVGKVDELRKIQEGEREERLKEREDREAQAVSMRQIIDEQMRAKDVMQKVRSVSPREARLESERCRSVRVSGLQETEAPLSTYQERQGSLRGELDRVLEVVCPGGHPPRVVEIRRLGDAARGSDRGPRPVLVRFDRESDARDVLANSWRLSRVDGLRRVFIDKDLSREERRRNWELRREAKERNEELTDEERTRYFFAVRRGR